MTRPGPRDAHGAVVGFFSRALAGFQASRAPFEVVCTLPPRSSWRALASDTRRTHDPAPLRPASSPRTLVVLDSSFNPPTRAHLHMASTAVRDVDVDVDVDVDAGPDDALATRTRLLLLLAVHNADKAPRPAALEQRLAMMWAFARDVARDLDRGGQTGGHHVVIDVGLTTKPYFHDKSAAVAAADFYGPGPTRHVFLAGYDTLVRILDPKYYSNSDAETPAASAMQAALAPLFERARLRVTLRPGGDCGAGDEQEAWVRRVVDRDGRAWAESIDIVRGLAGPVSSTLAREAAATREWERVHEMVPPEVGEWVSREGLYLE